MEILQHCHIVWKCFLLRHNEFSLIYTRVGSYSPLFRYESSHLNQAFTWSLNPSNFFPSPNSRYLLECVFSEVYYWQKPTKIWLFFTNGLKKTSLIWVINVFPHLCFIELTVVFVYMCLICVNVYLSEVVARTAEKKKIKKKKLISD